MQEYEWEVKVFEPETNTFLVQYTSGNKSVLVNLPLPNVDLSYEQLIKDYAPADKLNPPAAVSVPVGAKGKGVLSSRVDSEQPNMNGAWNEEYIRAMIYQVFEEIREALV